MLKTKLGGSLYEPPEIMYQVRSNYKMRLKLTVRERQCN